MQLGIYHARGATWVRAKLAMIPFAADDIVSFKSTSELP